MGLAGVGAVACSCDEGAGDIVRGHGSGGHARAGSTSHGNLGGG